MSATKIFRNTDERFGVPGPWEADSREDLADQMQETFDTWANEAEDRASQNGDEFDRAGWLEQTRQEFLGALIEEAA